MAVEITGDPEDVKRYREILAKRGQYTKRVHPVYARKHEDFRVCYGTLKVQSKPTNKGNDSENDTKYDPDDKLYIAGTANANIVDRSDERVNPAGLDATNFLKNPVLISDHMYFNQSVIGRVEELSTDEGGVRFNAFIGDPRKAPLTNMQKDVRNLVAQGLLNTVSIGFIPTKIKAPRFDDDGKLVEPAVIESFELLELSVVAIPANPDATFEMRQLAEQKRIALNATRGVANSGLTSGVSQRQTEVEYENFDDLWNWGAAYYKKTVRQYHKFIFDPDLFTQKSAVLWLEKRDYKAKDFLVSDDGLEFEQQKEAEFKGGTLRVIDIEDGVKAVVGQLTKEYEMDEKTAEDLVDGVKGIATTLSGVADGIKGLQESNAELLKAFAKSKGKEEDEEEEEEDDEKKRLGKVETTLKGLGESQEKLATVLGKIWDRLDG